MSYSINRTFPLKLTTVTPVSIGGDQGKLLSPYADYVLSSDESYVYYLQKELIEKAVLEKQKLGDYIRFIQLGMDNNRSDFNLLDFIQNTLKLELNEVTSYKLPNWGLYAKDRKQIQPVVKSAGNPFIPGSSIKGALRTAMLYDWLANTSEGETELAKYFHEIELWRNRQKADQRNLFVEENLFGKLKDNKGQDSRRIKVSDTNCIKDGLVVLAAKRIRLKPEGKQSKSSDIPTPREAVFSEHPLHFKLSIEPSLSNPVLDYWEKEDIGGVLKIINAFAIAAIDNEIYELEHADDNKFKQEINSMLEFYHDLKQRADNGEIFLRIGFGKTQYDNSLALALIRDEDKFLTFRKWLWKVSPKKEIHPVTRTVTPGGKPLGWVKLEPI